MEDGELPGEEFISGLQDFLDDETRRPLTDHVVVKGPQTVEYTIEGTYYISRDRQEMAAVIQKQVEAARDEFIRWQKSAIARDINPSRLIYGPVSYTHLDVYKRQGKKEVPGKDGGGHEGL